MCWIFLLKFLKYLIAYHFKHFFLFPRNSSRSYLKLKGDCSLWGFFDPTTKRELNNLSCLLTQQEILQYMVHHLSPERKRFKYEYIMSKDKQKIITTTTSIPANTNCKTDSLDHSNLLYCWDWYILTEESISITQYIFLLPPMIIHTQTSIWLNTWKTSSNAAYEEFRQKVHQKRTEILASLREYYIKKHKARIQKEHTAQLDNLYDEL